MERAEIEASLFAALQRLYQTELPIIQIDVAERTICGQLRGILAEVFPDHSVHAEYNRHGLEPKDIEMPNADGEPTTTRVLPDIVVHRPMTDDSNLLVIEVKKSTNPLSDYSDLVKLEQMKLRLGYTYAAFLRLPTGPGAEFHNVQVTWV